MQPTHLDVLRTSNLLVFILANMKHVETRQFWKITVKNYDYRPTMYEWEEYPTYIYRWDNMATVRRKRKHYFKGRWEKTELYLDWAYIWEWKNTWINRSRQKFDFCTSTYHALNDALQSITRAEYDKYRADFEKVREYVRD